MPSVIVPARNGFEQTSRCLGTLLYSLARLNLKCEFILVDDASDEAERIQEVFRNHRTSAKGHETKIIRSRKHQHYSRAFSIGQHFATRDVVFFISNDMIVTPYFLQTLLLVSSLSREFGIVRGTSNYVDSHSGTHGAAERTIEVLSRRREFFAARIRSPRLHPC